MDAAASQAASRDRQRTAAAKRGRDRLDDTSSPAPEHAPNAGNGGHPAGWAPQETTPRHHRRAQRLRIRRLGIAPVHRFQNCARQQWVQLKREHNGKPLVAVSLVDALLPNE